MADDNDKLRIRSGHITCPDPLVGLVYDLLRDFVHPSDLEDLVRGACRHSHQDIVYTNGWLAQYAQDVVMRLDQARKRSAQTQEVSSREPSVPTDP